MMCNDARDGTQHQFRLPRDDGQWAAALVEADVRMAGTCDGSATFLSLCPGKSDGPRLIDGEPRLGEHGHCFADIVDHDDV